MDEVLLFIAPLQPRVQRHVLHIKNGTSKQMGVPIVLFLLYISCIAKITPPYPATGVLAPFLQCIWDL